MKDILAQDDYVDWTHYATVGMELEALETASDEFSYAWNFENSDERIGEKIQEASRPYLLPKDSDGKLFSKSHSQCLFEI